MRIAIWSLLLFGLSIPNTVHADYCTKYLDKFNFKEISGQATLLTGNYRVQMVGPNIKNLPCRGQDIWEGVLIDLFGDEIVVKVFDASGKEVQNVSVNRIKITYDKDEMFIETLYTESSTILIKYIIKDGSYVMDWAKSPAMLKTIKFW